MLSCDFEDPNVLLPQAQGGVGFTYAGDPPVIAVDPLQPGNHVLKVTLRKNTATGGVARPVNTYRCETEWPDIAMRSGTPGTERWTGVRIMAPAVFTNPLTCLFQPAHVLNYVNGVSDSVGLLQLYEAIDGNNGPTYWYRAFSAPLGPGGLPRITNPSDPNNGYRISCGQSQINTWVDWVFRFRASTSTSTDPSSTSSGIIEVYRNGVKQWSFVGKNIAAGDIITAKWGIYIGTTNDFVGNVDQVVYYDDLTIGDQTSSYDQVAPRHSLTVNGGTGSGRYPVLTPVSVNATPPPHGIFDHWVTSGGATIGSTTSSTTTVTMSTLNATVTALYQFPLNVTSGIGSGNFLSGTKPTITATVPVGQRFVSWTAVPNTVTITSPTSLRTTIAMPASAVTLTPVFTTLYALNVVNGSAAATSYAAGDSVLITAATPPAGQLFDHWTVDAGSLVSTSMTPTTFTMPASPATVTAWYTAIPAPTYTLSVTSGAGSGSYAAGASVSITAASATAGYVFDKWIINSGSPALSSMTSATATLTMPATTVAITATYKTQPVNTWVLSVVNGSGDGPYPANAAVPISADPAAVGNVFDHWATSGGTLASANAANTTLIMPAANVTVSAVYRTLSNAVTVNGGTGSALYGYGTTVTIQATIPMSKQFSQWVVASNSVVLTSSTSATTTFTMPASPVTVTAQFTDLYSLNVIDGSINGSLDASYPAGAIVPIVAATPPSGERFDHWDIVSGSVVLGSANSPTTTVIMPAGAVTVDAQFVPLLAIPSAPSAPAASADGTITGSTQPGVSVNIQVDGVLVTSVTADTVSGDWNWLIAGVTPGSHQLSVTAQNSAGTSAPSPAITITVQAQSPADPPQAPSGGGGGGSCGLGSGMAGLLLGLLVLAHKCLCYAGRWKNGDNRETPLGNRIAKSPVKLA
jgi:Divergent InlB B-repeat domain